MAGQQLHLLALLAACLDADNQVRYARPQPEHTTFGSCAASAACAAHVPQYKMMMGYVVGT